MLTIAPLFGLRTPLCVATHLFGALASAALMYGLWRQSRGRFRHQLVLLCFGASAVVVYSMSALYHAVIAAPATIFMLQMLDQSAIYLLIAGTYTPTVALLYRQPLKRDLFLAMVWGLALAGIAAKWLLTAQSDWVTLAPYLALGWVGVFAYPEIRHTVGHAGVLWVIYGGLAYTAGALFDSLQWPILAPRYFGPHEVFHVLVLLGTFCHYRFIRCFVVPYARRSAHAWRTTI